MIAHNLRVGEIIHAYNLAHSNLFLIFWHLSPEPGKYDAALDLWHTAKTDRGQREMLEGIVRHTTKIGAIHRHAILWAIGSLNTLSAFRNDAAHTEMQHYYDAAMVGMSAKRQTAARLTESPIEKHHKKLVGDLFALTNYLFDMQLDIMMAERLPSTRRPQLRLARSQSPRSQTKRRQAKKAARERQRQSSPE